MAGTDSSAEAGGHGEGADAVVPLPQEQPPEGRHGQPGAPPQGPSPGPAPERVPSMRPPSEPFAPQETDIADRRPLGPARPPAAGRDPADAAPRGATAPAHTALRESFLDNRINSHEWTAWGFRLVPDVKRRLELRLARDKRSSDNRRLAQGHYVNAAILQLPDSVEQQLQMVRTFIIARVGCTPPGRQSTYRVSWMAWQTVRDLDIELTSAAKRGLVVFLFSAAVEDFLERLDNEGPLRPDEFRPRGRAL
jgi:hypothetical protein